MSRDARGVGAARAARHEGPRRHALRPGRRGFTSRRAALRRPGGRAGAGRDSIEETRPSGFRGLRRAPGGARPDDAAGPRGGAGRQGRRPGRRPRPRRLRRGRGARRDVRGPARAAHRGGARLPRRGAAQFAGARAFFRRRQRARAAKGVTTLGRARGPLGRGRRGAGAAGAGRRVGPRDVSFGPAALRDERRRAPGPRGGRRRRRRQLALVALALLVAAAAELRAPRARLRRRRRRGARKSRVALRPRAPGPAVALAGRISGGRVRGGRHGGRGGEITEKAPVRRVAGRLRVHNVGRRDAAAAAGAGSYTGEPAARPAAPGDRRRDAAISQTLARAARRGRARTHRLYGLELYGVYENHEEARQEVERRTEHPRAVHDVNTEKRRLRGDGRAAALARRPRALRRVVLRRQHDGGRVGTPGSRESGERGRPDALRRPGRHRDFTVWL
mmetsp:Transcript_14909/g.44459  ORF Transcript_14909/g.44459 Transcript_14909/m.44459 type:complete len:447 (-) Transcript_14909:1724-3064(-)